MEAPQVIGYILGLYRVNGKANGSSQSYRVYIRGCVGIMDKKMEAPKVIGYILGF